MRRLFALSVASLFALPLAAALTLPQESPAKVVMQEVGISKVTISFHSPAVKGRTIWGGLVPYDRVWRLGANNATTIELSHDAKVNGVAVPAGRYALFAIPAADQWTLIFNKTPEQWGAFFYKQDQDLVRFSAKPQAASFRERFDIETLPADENTIDASIRWEKVSVPFTITFDTAALTWKSIDAEVAKKPDDWQTLNTAANYAFRKGARLDDAMKWIDHAMELKEHFWNYELKAKLLDRAGSTADALPYLDKAVANAKGKAPAEYIENLERTAAEYRAKLAKK
jgi:hypothetical protein